MTDVLCPVAERYQNKNSTDKFRDCVMNVSGLGVRRGFGGSNVSKVFSDNVSVTTKAKLQV